MKPLPQSLNNDQIAFWLANTTMTKEQILEWYSGFQEYSEKHKALDEENFIKFFEKLKHSKKRAEDLHKLLFKAFDTDSSGTVDFQEFLVAFNIIGDGDIEKRLAWMFDVYDINRDSSIDRKEIDTILRAILKMNKKKLVGDQTTETKIDEIFMTLDHNENHKISRDEFITNCSNNIFLREILCPDLA